MLYKEALKLCKKAGLFDNLLTNKSKTKAMEDLTDDIAQHRDYYSSIDRGDAGPYRKGQLPLDMEEVYDPNTYETLSYKPVQGKYKIDAKTFKLLRKLIEEDRKEGIRTGWLRPEDAKRRLYLHAVRRLRGNDEQPVKDPELILDIRDKDDPKFRYSDAVSHDVSWYKGTKGLSYNG